jgi:hypothetical protein
LSIPDYLSITRSRAFCVLSVVALLVIYEAGLLWMGSGRRNAAGVMLSRVLDGIHPLAGVFFHLVLLVLFLSAAVVAARRRDSLAVVGPLFLLESAVWASILAPAVLFLRTPFLAMPGGEDLLLDIGAGVYEELLFRFLLLGLVLRLAQVDPWSLYPVEKERPDGPAAHLPLAFVAVLLSAIAFALYHHVGPGGQPFSWGIFCFRSLAGLLLSLLFLIRGLGVAVYTHAIYDVLVHFL